MLALLFICRFRGLRNRCICGLANRMAVIFAPATESKLNRFCHLPCGELMWHVSTHGNDSDIAPKITAFDPRRGKHRRLIPFLVYALVYLIIASNHVALDTLSPWFDSVCTHTCSPSLGNPS